MKKGSGKNIINIFIYKLYFYYKFTLDSFIKFHL